MCMLNNHVLITQWLECDNTMAVYVTDNKLLISPWIFDSLFQKALAPGL